MPRQPIALPFVHETILGRRQEVPEIPTAIWLDQMWMEWEQGEHVALMGQTGSGKTTLARDLLKVRDYVVVLAVKRFDDTLDSFTAAAGYTRSSWPPDYNRRRVLIWPRPKDIDDIDGQGKHVHRVLKDVSRSGGWALFLDDTGYITGMLGEGKSVTALLNTGRSGHISVVTAMTQPTSVAARIPTETLRQVRHVLVFPYQNQRDTDTISKIVGYNRRDIEGWMKRMDPHDFLAFSHGKVTLVRHTYATKQPILAIGR